MNFQNIPRGEKVIKKAFLPKQDALVFFDYSQIEYRLLAYYLAVQLGETRMAEAFKAGLDPHAETAKLIFEAIGREYHDPLTDEERQFGKTGNFSIVYAGGTPTIIRQLTRAGIPCDYPMAKTILDAIKEQMPEVTALNESIYETLETRATGRENDPERYGYITTLWGRHLRPDSSIIEKEGKRSAYRKMLNALIQGCAADLMRHAMREVHRGLRENGCRAHTVNSVHDEIQIDSPEDELDFLAENVPIWMDYDLVTEVVPVLTDMEVSFTNWAEKEKYEKEDR